MTSSSSKSGGGGSNIQQQYSPFFAQGGVTGPQASAAQYTGMEDQIGALSRMSNAGTPMESTMATMQGGVAPQFATAEALSGMSNADIAALYGGYQTAENINNQNIQATQANQQQANAQAQQLATSLGSLAGRAASQGGTQSTTQSKTT